MANTFTKDILIQAPNPKQTAAFYVDHLGFTITAESPTLISLEGQHLNLYIEPGPALGPVLEVKVANVEAAKLRLQNQGCTILKDEATFPRCYLQDPQGLIYNLTT